jgi:hypothetical protein
MADRKLSLRGHFKRVNNKKNPDGNFQNF